MEHERLRVQLALLIQLAGITGSRPGALMSLTYRDFKLSLLRDLKGSEWPSLVVDVTFRNTKSFLGPKAPCVARVMLLVWSLMRLEESRSYSSSS